ncbi:hypothetical protein EDB81DRAFT_933824 [Dactylonectria macrodidyma]|uniref:Rhodopsin domain-containing protein n=1 Tax=Dactylonectria macrodidyma TaxID=307937 RepID=A0A9P9J8B1_9HYPO|nr:hypothetical protein EDB81DRAFT_933824 [Dactylonectria macrodidyma]
MAQSTSPPDGDTSTAPVVLGILGVVLGLAFLLYLTRIYTRVRPTYKLNFSDYAISVAFVFELAAFALLIAAITEGLGRQAYYLEGDANINISHLLFFGQILGPWVASLSRASVAYLLLQLPVSLLWRVILVVSIAFQFVVAISANVIRLVHCIPIRANWDPAVPDAHCWTMQQSKINTFVFGGLVIASDFLFATMPMFVVWNLNRPTLERILISVLMALGLCATAVVIVKIVGAAAPTTTTHDPTRDIIKMQLWCRLEDCCLLASASVPYLKAPIINRLSRLGFQAFKYTDRNLNSVQSFGHHDSSKDTPVPRGGLQFKMLSKNVLAVLSLSIAIAVIAKPPHPKYYLNSKGIVLL